MTENVKFENGKIVLTIEEDEFITGIKIKRRVERVYTMEAAMALFNTIKDQVAVIDKEIAKLNAEKAEFNQIKNCPGYLWCKKHFQLTDPTFDDKIEKQETEKSLIMERITKLGGLLNGPNHI